MAAAKSMTSNFLGIEEITSGLTKTILADKSKAKKAEKGQGQQTTEEDEAIDALGTAWSNCSLEDAEEAEAQREAQRLREQTQKEPKDKMRALKLADQKRESDEYDALQRQFQEHGPKVHEMKRKERNEAAAKQRRLAAEAETSALAEKRAQEERRIQEERRMQEEALAAQVKRDADDRVRLELLQMYERNLAESNAIAIAQANAKEAQWQQQRHEAEQIAQYQEVVARQAYYAKLEQRQQEEFFLQQQLAEQHQAYPQGEQVAGSTEETDAAQGFEEMDTAPEAFGVTEMDWVQAEETMPLLAEPLVPLSESVPPPSSLALEPSASTGELQLPSASFSGEVSENQVLQFGASSSWRIEERPMEANAKEAKEATAATAAAAEAVAELAAAEESATVEPAVQEPATAASATLAPILRLPPRPAAPLPCEATPQSARAAIQSPLPAPMPAPAQSSQKAIKIVSKRAVPGQAFAAFRSTISVWSPLGRLLSQQKTIPKDAKPHVLGKRAREESEHGGPSKKKAKLDGELCLEVGGKRKREIEVFSGNKRAMLGKIPGRVLAVPGSRFATSPLIASPPPIAPTPTSPNALPSPIPSLTPPTTTSPPLPPAGQPLPANPYRGLAEAIELYNDLPTLRAEIEWMKAQRRLKSSQKTIKRIAPPASSWSKYRENPLR